MEEIATILSTLTYLVEELAKEVKEKEPENILANNAERYISRLRGDLDKKANNPGQ